MLIVPLLKVHFSDHISIWVLHYIFSDGVHTECGASAGTRRPFAEHQNIQPTTKLLIKQVCN